MSEQQPFVSSGVKQRDRVTRCKKGLWNDQIVRRVVQCVDIIRYVDKKKEYVDEPRGALCRHRQVYENTRAASIAASYAARNARLLSAISSAEAPSTARHPDSGSRMTDRIVYPIDVPAGWPGV